MNDSGVLGVRVLPFAGRAHSGLTLTAHGLFGYSFNTVHLNFSKKLLTK
jgi:hypothetical protein